MSGRATRVWSLCSLAFGLVVTGCPPAQPQSPPAEASFELVGARPGLRWEARFTDGHRVVDPQGRLIGLLLEKKSDDVVASRLALRLADLPPGRHAITPEGEVGAALRLFGPPRPTDYQAVAGWIDLAEVTPDTVVGQLQLRLEVRGGITPEDGFMLTGRFSGPFPARRQVDGN